MTASVKSGRFPGWAVMLSLFFLVGVVVIFSLYFIIKGAETRRWEEMRLQCAELARQAGSANRDRPVLYGTALPGNAWDDYESALRLTPIGSGFPAGEYLSSAKPDRAKALAVVQLHAPSIQALRRGAARSFARREVDSEYRPLLNSQSLYDLGLLAACQARLYLEEGKTREAAELLLDAGQYGGDLARQGTLHQASIGRGILLVVLDELKLLLHSRKGSREDLLELARALDQLDQKFPLEGDSYLYGSMELGFEFLRRDRMDVFFEQFANPAPKSPTWRFAYSERLLLTDAFQSNLLASRQFKETAEKPWIEAREIRARALGELEGSSNPLVRVLCKYSLPSGSLPDAGDSFRECRAKLRLLRVAAHFRATGEVPDLADPYGTKIVSSRNGNHLKLWSVGADGIDDAGTGEWHPWKGKDIVLELER